MTRASTIHRITRRRTAILASALGLGLVAPSLADLILSPGNDTVLGGQILGGEFVVGGPGSDADGNAWPANESPEKAVDGVGQKYLNFGEENTGLVVTPANGRSIVTSMTLYTANDAEERDPRSYSLYGTNAALGGGGSFPVADFTLISSSSLSLPAGRNPGGNSPLGPSFQTVNFDNANPYSSYLIIFPHLKQNQGGFGDANSMQISEIVLEGTFPRPGTAAPAPTIGGGGIEILPATPATAGETLTGTGRLVIDSTLGDPSAGTVSRVTASGYQLNPGYVGQLYDITSLAFTATPNPVTESETTQLSSGPATLDDDTVLALAPADVSWRVVTGPIATIDENGLATAGVVGATTPATLEGALLNFSDQFVVTVNNTVTLTEFEQWQLDNFGSTTAPEAQPGANPDGDPDDNFFEFIAGLDPNDPASFLHLRVERVPGQPDHRRIIFSPRLPDRTYRVLQSPDLTASSFTAEVNGATSDNGSERIVTDQNATPAERFYRLEITK